MGGVAHTIVVWWRQSDEFVRDAVTILNIGAQAACTGLTMSVLSLAPEVKLALYRFGTAVAHHHLHGEFGAATVGRNGGVGVVACFVGCVVIEVRTCCRHGRRPRSA